VIQSIEQFEIDNNFGDNFSDLLLEKERFLQTSGQNHTELIRTYTLVVLSIVLSHRNLQGTVIITVDIRARSQRRQCRPYGKAEFPGTVRLEVGG
jgi:hypothetical protein